MAQYGHLTTLDADECRLLLGTRRFGRVGWNSASGVQILPVSYGMVGDTIVFRTMAASPLAELVRPVEVSFQVDDLDDETTTGWSILVHGMSGSPVMVKRGEGESAMGLEHLRLVGVYSGRDRQEPSEFEAELGIVWPLRECLLPILETYLEEVSRAARPASGG